MGSSGRALALWLRTSLRAAPGLVGILAALQIAQSALVPAQAYGVARLVDRVAAGRDPTGAVVLIVAAFAAGIVAEAVMEPLSSTVYERIHREIHRDLLELTGAVPTIAHHEQPEVADRLEHLCEETWRLSRCARTLMLVVGTLAGAVTVLWLLASVHAALLVLPVLGVIRVGVASANGRLLWASIAATTPQARLVRRLLDLACAPQHAMEIRVFGLRSPLVGRVRSLLREITKVQGAASRRGAARDAAVAIGFTACYLAALGLILVRAGQGRTSAGDAALVVLLATRIDQVAAGLADSARELGQMVGLFGGYVWLRDHAQALRRPAARDPAPASLAGGITLDGLGFRYSGASGDTLTGVDLHVPAGTTVAVVGDNGAGKTTLVKLLLQLYQPAAGTVRAGPADLGTVHAPAWWARTSAAFQDFCRYELTAREAVGVGDLPRCGDAAALAHALRHGDAEAVVAALPAGLDTQLGAGFPGGVDLSGGQWQRIALARAFMRLDPLLLVLDEPTAALDAQAEYDLFERFAAAARQTGHRGGVTVLVSHRFSTVRMADLIVVLADGRVTEVGDHVTLLARGGRYAEMFELQARAYR